MKLNDAYLCPDYNEVFSYKEQKFPYNHYPICPICGSKNLLNLGRVLNCRVDDFRGRVFPAPNKEDKNEAHIGIDFVGDSCSTDHTTVIADPPDHGTGKDAEQITDGGDKSRDRRSGGEDSECSKGGLTADQSIARINFVGDVLGKLFQAGSDLNKAVSRLDADPTFKSTLA